MLGCNRLSNFLLCQSQYNNLCSNNKTYIFTSLQNMLYVYGINWISDIWNIISSCHIQVATYYCVLLFKTLSEFCVSSSIT